MHLFRVMMGLGLLAGAGTLRAENRYPTTFDNSSAPVLMKKILDLESRKDAKCWTSANHLENYISGTALSDAARQHKIELQKTLIREVWTMATGKTEGGEISPDTMKKALGKRLPMAKTELGGARIRTATGTIDISAVDLAHYDSVAFALRAVLAVQQEDLLKPPATLLKLAPDGVDALVDFVNIFTVTALHLGNRQARKENHALMTVEDLTSGWNALRPGSAGE
ncbi:MAG: hypothetical protein AAF492_04240 [Verrucomicrobiota bacterium]